jgi:hypothetical protein
VHLIDNHDFFHPEHGYAFLGETIIIFADGTSRTLVPISLTSYIGNVFHPSNTLITSQIRGHLL